MSLTDYWERAMVCETGMYVQFLARAPESKTKSDTDSYCLCYLLVTYKTCWFYCFVSYNYSNILYSACAVVSLRPPCICSSANIHLSAAD